MTSTKPHSLDESKTITTFIDLVCININTNHQKSTLYLEKAILINKDQTKNLLIKKLNPNNVKTHYNLATLLEDHFEEYNLAKQHYEKALKLNPNDADVHYNLAILLQHHFEEYIHIMLTI